MESTEEVGYRERALWASLAAVALVDTIYFAVVVYRWLRDEPLTAAGLTVLLVGIAIVLLAIEIGFGLANKARREPMDERDEAIAAKSARLAYVVFVTGVLVALGVHLLSADAQAGPLLGIPLIEVHLILASLVSAELVRYASALQRYRAGS